MFAASACVILMTGATMCFTGHTITCNDDLQLAQMQGVNGCPKLSADQKQICSTRTNGDGVICSPLQSSSGSQSRF